MRTRRVIALGLLFLLLAGPASAQGTLSVQIGDIRAPHGEDVEIPIDVTGASQVGALRIELSYDASVLSPIRSVETGGVSAGAAIQHYETAPGKLTISMIHAQGFSGDGTVAKVTVRVAGKDGVSTPLKLLNVTANHVQTKVVQPSTLSDGTFTEGGGGGSVAVWGLFGLLAVVIVGAGAYAFTRRTTRRPAAAQPTAAAATMGLMVVRGSASPASVFLSQPVTTIGRSSTSNLVVDDEMASREHARVVSSGGAHTLYDLGSANGTFVNGQQVTQRVLQVGDQITVGSTTLVVR